MACCLKAYLEYDINLREGGALTLPVGIVPRGPPVTAAVLTSAARVR